MSLLDEIKHPFKNGNNVLQLIVVNLLVFVFVNIFYILALLTGGDIVFESIYTLIIQNLSLPLSIENFISKPWTLITHFFLHTEIFHAFFNLFVLYFFGKLLQDFGYKRTVLPLYFYGAITGALLSLLAYYFLPGLKTLANSSTAIGASAGVMAILTGSATLFPNVKAYALFFEIPLKYLALFIFIIDIISLKSFDNPGGHIAHIGGAALGFLFVNAMKKGSDWSLFFNNALEKLKEVFSFSRNKNIKVVYRKKMSDEDYNAAKIDLQNKLDSILDKISKSGYESLSKEEKDILFKSSKKL